MPLTAKGEEILANMRKQYGAEEGERVFYASKAKGTISGVDSDEVVAGAPLIQAPDPVRTKGAGILLIAPGGQALFLKRGPGGDFPGAWCFPGGTTEAGEAAEDTAKRETIEEIGHLPKGTRSLHSRTITAVPGGSVDFTTFLQRVDETFQPEVNGEHVGFAWAPVGEPPQPLHPGAAVALAKLDMDELAIARAMVAGTLTSPQRYENLSLFAMRITGIGAAYRSNGDEFVWRKAEVYLNPDFLARCNGLPVLWEHPKKAVLTSKEFNDRVVGTVFLPYIAGDEVWGIVKIWDDEARELLETERLSTSPTVTFRDPTVNQRVELDGMKLLIEGKPSLLDHLAICEQGVWDKGGEPVGVRSETIGDSSMTDKEKADAEAKAKADAEAKEKADAEAKEKADKARADAGGNLDKVLAGIDAICGRMDSFDKRMDSMEGEYKADKKARADAEEEEKKKADAAKADAEKEEKEKADAKAKADAEEEEKKKADAAAKANGDLGARLTQIETVVKPLTDADFAAMAGAQATADKIFHAFGDSAPRPSFGESAAGYERRVFGMLKKHSKTWKDVDTTDLNGPAFAVARDQVYADAMQAAVSPATVPPGRLRAIRRTLESGHVETTFVGQPIDWMKTFMPNRRFVQGQINHKNLDTRH